MACRGRVTELCLGTSQMGSFNTLECASTMVCDNPMITRRHLRGGRRAVVLQGRRASGESRWQPLVQSIASLSAAAANAREPLPSPLYNREGATVASHSRHPHEAALAEREQAVSSKHPLPLSGSVHSKRSARGVSGLTCRAFRCMRSYWAAVPESVPLLHAYRSA